MGHIHPFLLQQQTPGDIRSLSAKTSGSAPEHNSHCQISAMKREYEEDTHTLCLDSTHTHIQAHSRQTDTANAHTHTHTGDVLSRDSPDV